MLSSIRIVLPIAIILALSGCGKIDLSSLLPEKNASELTPAQGTGADTSLKPIFADPKPGDLYSADLVYFSIYWDTDKDVVFGMMRVDEVHPDRLVVITEKQGWDNPKQAMKELRSGDLSQVEWDEHEQIEIYRSELPQLLADEKILDARRG